MLKTRQRARLRAREVRKEFGISPVAPLDVWKLLQAASVAVIKESLKGNVSGLFLRFESAEVILVNTARTLGHQNFTAAHEYFHLRYNPEMQGKACQAAVFDPRAPVEREADHFAAYLLAPDEAITFWLGRRRGWQGEAVPLGWADVIALEQVFGLSHQAMLIRLREMGLISVEQEASMRQGVVRRATELGYSLDLYRPTRERVIISDYAEKAKKALDLGLISPGRYEELLLEAGLADVLYGLEEEVAEDEEASL